MLPSRDHVGLEKRFFYGSSIFRMLKTMAETKKNFLNSTINSFRFVLFNELS